MEVLHRYSNVSYLLTQLQRAQKSSSGKRRATASPRSQPHNIKKRLGPEALTQLEADYQAGHTTRQLAAKYKIGKTTIQAYLRQAGIVLRRQALTPDQLNEALELYETGLSFDTIGATLGVAGCTVYRAFETAGLPIRRRRLQLT